MSLASDGAVTVGENIGDDAHDLLLPDGTTWRPWHTWHNESSVWVDGRIWSPSAESKVESFDVGCPGDECCVTSLDALAAFVCWQSGSVLLAPGNENHTTALIVPFETLTLDLIQEAFTRAFTHGLLPLPASS